MEGIRTVGVEERWRDVGVRGEEGRIGWRIGTLLVGGRRKEVMEGRNERPNERMKER